MSDQSIEVERLDYDEPPEHYSISGEGDEWEWQGDDRCTPHACGDAESEADAIAQAWGWHKMVRDPPGMSVYRSGPAWLWEVDATDGRTGEAHSVEYGQPDAEETAREAAWVWHDRRLALADALDVLEFGLTPICSQPLWPRILAWPDKLVAYGEAYLQNSDQRPWSDEHEREGEQSHGTGLPVPTGEPCPRCERDNISTIANTPHEIPQPIIDEAEARGAEAFIDFAVQVTDRIIRLPSLTVEQRNLLARTIFADVAGALRPLARMLECTDETPVHLDAQMREVMGPDGFDERDFWIVLVDDTRPDPGGDDWSATVAVKVKAGSFAQAAERAGLRLEIGDSGDGFYLDSDDAPETVLVADNREGKDARRFTVVCNVNIRHLAKEVPCG